VAADGSIVLLPDQDRGRWDHALIVEGQEMVRACLRRGQPGPLEIQAAIGAVRRRGDRWPSPGARSSSSTTS
jgi:RNA polymerase sigma-70 factor (ECF subfamily)